MRARFLPVVAMGCGVAAWAGAAFGQPAPARPGGAPAARPQPAAPAPAEPKADSAFEAARTAFEVLPEADRRAIQEALVWTGDFNGVDSGTFGRRTYDALLAYARRAGLAADGTLSPADRAGLLASGRKARDAAGFAVRRDAATGSALGVPGRVLPRQSALPQGTRWQSADGRVTLETRLLPPGEADLAATFDRLSASTPERRVTYRLKRPDFLVVTGETPTGRFHIRYADSPAGLRGFTFAYDKALAAETDKLVIAVANSFDPRPADASAPVPAGAVGGAAPASTVTAFEIEPGRLLTSAAAIAGCGTLRIGAATAAVIGRSGRLALVGTAERPRAAPLRVAPTLAAGDALVVLPSDGATGVTAMAGEAATPTRLSAPLQPGAAGAPVFDRQNRFVGLVASYPAAPQRIAGIVPQATYDLVPAAEAASLLRQPITVAARGDAAVTAGDIARDQAGSVRTLTCVP